jgi:hypothetical protein
VGVMVGLGVLGGSGMAPARQRAVELEEREDGEGVLS